MIETIKRNTTLDCLKGIAAIGIVLIHFGFIGSIGAIIQVIARFGVPVFFMCSGFYLKKNKINSGKIKLKASHIARLLLIGIVGYLLFNIIWCGPHYIIQEISISNVVKFIVFNAPQISAPHLWFLSALLYSYGIVYLIYNLGAIKYRVFIIIFLLSIHVILAELLLILGIEISHPIVRNAYLFGTPFLLIGDWISDNLDYVEKWNDKVFIAMAILGFFLSIIEKYAISPDDLLELYMGSIISSVSMFALCVKHPTSNVKIMSFVGNKCSLGVYIIHPMIGTIIGRIYFTTIDIWCWLKPIMIITLSIIAGWIFNCICMELKSGRSHALRRD